MSDRKILLTELFYSIQGEGVYNGVPSIFVRLFGCNFECNGFSNTDPDGNIGDIEIKQVDSIAELSNEDFTKGCDSRYSWHKDYEHLSQKLTAHEIAEQIVDQLPGETFSLGQDNIHLVFTGGEPMMNQSEMIDIMKALVSLDVGFENEVTVTIETNGSLRMTRKLRDFFDYSLPDNHVLFSVSPKLSASGEPKALAFNLPAVKSYILENSQFSFKFVVGNQEHVDEVVDYCEEVLADPTLAEYPCPVYLMPVGATAEQQNEILPWVASVCMQAGWFLSMRSHVYIFGNELGT